MIIIGIDPGLSGAFAVYSGDRLLHVEDLPVLEFKRNGKNKRDLDVSRLAKRIQGWAPSKAIVEKVGAMPGQGVSSVFSFGKTYGAILGILGALEVPVDLVAPQVWKKKLGVPAGKDGARARASQLIPAGAEFWPLKKHDGRAESALIAYYGAANG